MDVVHVFSERSKSAYIHMSVLVACFDYVLSVVLVLYLHAGELADVNMASEVFPGGKAHLQLCVQFKSLVGLFLAVRDARDLIVVGGWLLVRFDTIPVAFSEQEVR